jgi:hypothetical protein
MGSGFSDMIGIEAAGDSLSKALLEAEANATAELRNVTLTAINYVKSYTPVISLLIVFLLLLLFVSILSVLSQMLENLGLRSSVRALIVLVVYILLYIWFVVVQIIAAVKLKNVTATVIASVAGIGLLVIALFTVWYIYRVCSGNISNPFSVQNQDEGRSTT